MVSGRFRVEVGALVENQHKEILLLKRSDYGSFPGIWDIVGGSKNQFEDPFEALFREIAEETGLVDIDVLKLVHIYHSELVSGTNENSAVIGVVFWCRTEQTTIKLSHEHTNYMWVNPQEALGFATHKDVLGSIKSFLKEKQRIQQS